MPFPEELTAEEKDYYRKYQFQASTEERAANLHDLQSTRNFSGRGGQLLTGRILSRIVSRTEEARRAAATIVGRLKGKTTAIDPLLPDRLQAFSRVARNCRHAVEYQYLLDVSKDWDLRRPYDLAAVKSIPEWLSLRRVARQELDNTALLIQSLESTTGPLLHFAPTPEETDIRILDANLIESLRKKLRIMIAHWEDHERLFMNLAIEPSR